MAEKVEGLIRESRARTTATGLARTVTVPVNL